MEKEKVLPLFLFLTLLSLFLLVLGNLGLTKPMVLAAERLTIPLKENIYRSWQGFWGNLGALGTWQTKLQRMAELENFAREEAVLRLKLQVLEEENQALRRQLEAPMPASMRFLPAKTLGLKRYLTIDKGEEDGVKLGLMVISENILVGKVVQVTPATAQVLLPQDPDSKIPSRTVKTQARGLVIGQFSTKAVLDKVLQADTLEEGDLVVTEIGGGEYLRDLLIGKVAKVEKKEVEPFQKAEVIPLLDYGKLVNVFVIK